MFERLMATDAIRVWLSAWNGNGRCSSPDGSESSIRRRRLEAFSVGVGEAERLAETGGLAVDNADGEEFLSRAARSVARY